MKKAIALFLSMCLFGGCHVALAAEGAVKESVELIVFAAASMNAALPKIADLYIKANPHVNIAFTFDSSGTLKTQIVEGAYCDIFISAGQKQMNAIDKAKDNPDGLDYVVEGSRIDLLENQIVLVVPEDNPAKIESFDDLGTDKINLMAIGNSDVPVGQYAAEILTNLGFYDKLNEGKKITFGTNTTEVTTQVAEGAVDAGIVYRTDVASAVNPESLKIIAAAPEGSVSRAIYPAALISVSKHQEEAKNFLAFLQGEEAAEILQSYGFSTDIK